MAEATKKRKDFNETALHTTKVVPGAFEGLKALKEMGFDLVLVTSRPLELESKTWEWLEANNMSE